ncbi:nucleotide-binding universal stress UspA family protein [Blastococcus colisei]|uniref:Nucleotide-binding universal stress UspA family protein n=1 Tax=Blastococcus colisei TaxID=1564162 RepID=A0A543PAE1_9ACTN|nr:universal stress protein [Blastococcus colisei]TQN41054.1 nucleotide-binding universal stress UspA family protein [Blastococcus colisei]
MSDLGDPEQAPETHAGSVIPPARTGEEPLADVAPLRLPPLLPRRQSPWLIVEVDGSATGHGALVWALREAARREATVVAVHVLDDPGGDPLEGSSRIHLRTRMAAHDRLDAQVLRAIAETGVHGRSRTAVLERPVFDALTAATHGADLVVVGARGKTLLRQAVPRPLTRRLARGA